MRKPSGRTARGILAATVVSAGGMVSVACNMVLEIDDFKFEECERGVLSCANDTTPQICDEDGQWANNGPPCSHQNKVCFAGVCTGECAPDQKRCAGPTPQTCDANGKWQSEPSCGAGQQCRGGICGGECTPGDLRCSDDLQKAQICNEEGQWIDEGSCVDAGVCSPGRCDRSTGRCVAAPAPDETAWPDGTECDDRDVCTVSSSCRAGVCTSSGPSSDRAWAHWQPASLRSTRYIYTDTDHVVFDSVTHLTWQRKVPAGEYAWDDAKKYCDCLNGVSYPGIICDADKVPGYPSGWRLPTRIELASIVDYERIDPAIDEAAFPGTPGESFWSSPYVAIDSAVAWFVDFFDGSVGLDSFDGKVGGAYRVRCVR
ncbi:DUF1566 domain-containing protein [Sorangium sp. So ce185]|uniref:Lcl C-terminal domain-containing protein n=1 Tax=Sorangium sp. So ce185 TaxID=3133287 RepID=UPI003F5EEEEC